MTATVPRINLSRTTPPSREWSEFLFVPDLLFAVATVLAWWLLDPDRGLAVLSLLACLFAANAALRRGGPYLLPSSVFFLAAGVFVGIAAYYLGGQETRAPTEDVRNAAALALGTTVAISIVVAFLSVQWRLRWNDTVEDGANRDSAFQPPRQFVLRACLLVVVSQIPLVENALGSIAGALGFAGILMLVMVGSTRRIRMRWHGDLVLVAAVLAAPLLWFYLEFQGGGRLALAGLAVAAFMGWNLVSPHRAQKIAVILLIPVFLLYAGWDRTDRRGDGGATAGSVVADGQGLGSVYGPLDTFAELIEPRTPEQMELIGPRYGGTFMNTLFLPIPRSMWEDKPVGFGRELVYSLEMTGVGENHSAAALFQGEWYANFGFAGLVFMVPVTGVFLAILDRSHNRLARGRMRTSRDWWRAVVLLCCVASLGELFWVGTFTWFARGGLAAVIAATVAWVSMRRVRLTRRMRVVAGPSDGAPGAGLVEDRAGQS